MSRGGQGIKRNVLISMRQAIWVKLTDTLVPAAKSTVQVAGLASAAFKFLSYIRLDQRFTRLWGIGETYSCGGGIAAWKDGDIVRSTRTSRPVDRDRLADGQGRLWSGAVSL